MIRTTPALAQIREIATAARRAFEAPPELLSDGSWTDFPRGCCADACLMLAELYRERGMNAVLVYAERHGGRSHVWLSVEGSIVDVTADQFAGEGMPRCFVAVTSEWHDAWTAADDHGIQSIEGMSLDTPSRSHLLDGLGELRKRLTSSVEPAAMSGPDESI